MSAAETEPVADGSVEQRVVYHYYPQRGGCGSCSSSGPSTLGALLEIGAMVVAIYWLYRTLEELW